MTARAPLPDAPFTDLHGGWQEKGGKPVKGCRLGKASHMSIVLSNSSNVHVKGTVFGTRLQSAIALGAYSPTRLALLGHELQTGEVALTQTAPRQTAAVLPTITMALLRTVRRAGPADIWAMKRGDLTVEALHKEQLANHRMSDAELKQIMVREGLDRVLALFDELTGPGKTNGHDAAVASNDNGGSGGVAMPAQLSL